MGLVYLLVHFYTINKCITRPRFKYYNVIFKIIIPTYGFYSNGEKELFHTVNSFPYGVKLLNRHDFQILQSRFSLAGGADYFYKSFVFNTFCLHFNIASKTNSFSSTIYCRGM